jgi:hypothetical protein
MAAPAAKSLIQAFAGNLLSARDGTKIVDLDRPAN